MRPKVVLDTNIMVSSIYGGHPRRIVEMWKAGQLTLLVTDETREEYLATLAEFVSSRTLGDWKTSLRRLTIEVRPATVPRVATHPEDDRFLGCAVGGRARYLVTGDGPMLKLGRYGVTRILQPATFVHELLS